VNASPPAQETKSGSPLRLRQPAVKQAVKKTASELQEDRATLIGAGIAFYWFLALFPGLLAAVGIVGLLPLDPRTVDRLIGGITTALPAGAADLITGAVEGASSGSDGGSVVATVTGIALALWSASAGFVAMQSGLNVAYEVPRDAKFFKARLRAGLLLFATGILGGTGIALVVSGRALGNRLEKGLLGDLLGPVFDPLWFTFRAISAILTLVTLFAIFYYKAPNRDSPRWTWITPGSVVGAAIWLIVSIGFTLSVRAFGLYGSTYGSLAGVVILLVFLYLTALAVVIGGELNAELEQSATDKRSTGFDAMLIR